MVKDITGGAFNKIAQAMTAQMRATPGPLQDSDITGHDILGLILCVYNIGNQSLLPVPPDAPAGLDPQNSPLFGPRMSLDGVDFKGTIAGMFMMPPTPLGILYILLEMLKSLLDTLPPGDQAEEITDATAAPENEC